MRASVRFTLAEWGRVGTPLTNPHRGIAAIYTRISKARAGARRWAAVFESTMDIAVQCTPTQAFDHVARGFFEHHGLWDPR